MRFFRKLRLRRAMDRDIASELAFHREMAASHGDAIPLGNTAVIAEQGYALRRFQFVENLWRDLVYAARGLRRSPGLVLAALVSLGLGIGVNAAMFSLGMEFLFSQPSLRDAGSILSVRLGGNSHAPHQTLEFLAAAGLFTDVVGENEEVIANYNDGKETRPVFGVFTTRNYFTALGIPMLHGRGLAPDDPAEAAVLSYAFWRKYLQGDPSIVGRTLNLDGRLCTVVGILPERHRTLIGFGYSPDIYMPRYLESTMLAIYARLKPGMSLAAAHAGLIAIARRMNVELPAAGYKYEEGMEVSPVAGWARLRFESDTLRLAVFFALLLVVTGLVLLIACVNVASLLLARAAARRREIAIRIAIGASRGRLLQQLLADSVLLSLLGACAGLALAEVSAMMLARIHLPLPLPIRLQITPDWRLACYGTFLAMVTMLACGLLPAWQSLKESIAPDLHREKKMRLRRALVGVQIAISVIVLATGFLFLRNLYHSSALNPGFDVVHTIRANVNLPPTGYTSPRKTAYIEQVVDSLAAIPGMERTAAARELPFNGGSHYFVELTFPDNGQKQRARFDWNAVTPEYFQTMSIPLVQGRTFLAADRGERVVVINSEFVRQYLGGRQGLGTVFLWGQDGKTPYRVVGVAEVTKTLTIGEAPKPQLYEPLSQIDNDKREIEFVMRSAIPPAQQLEAVRRTLHRIEPMAGSEVNTMYSSIGLAFLPSQVGALLMGSTGLVGLFLVTIGLSGVMAFSVAQRTREIGVRVAVGANRADIARLVLGDSARITLIGTVAGLLIALVVTKPLAMFLVPGLKPDDPLNYAVVALAMMATVLVATCGPLLRALKIDPNPALRQD